MKICHKGNFSQSDEIKVFTRSETGSLEQQKMSASFSLSPMGGSFSLSSEQSPSKPLELCPSFSCGRVVLSSQKKHTLPHEEEGHSSKGLEGDGSLDSEKDPPVGDNYQILPP